MIVVDASAALLALLNAGEARRALSNDTLIAPHLIDVEVTSALRRQVRTGVLEAAAAEECLASWQLLGLERVAVTHLLGRMWELRDNVTPYDAAYVAVAEELELPCSPATPAWRTHRVRAARPWWSAPDGSKSACSVLPMIRLLLRRIRLAWVWAVTMLIWRNRAAIIRTMQMLWYRIRGVEPPASVRARAVDTTGSERPG